MPRHIPLSILTLLFLNPLTGLAAESTVDFARQILPLLSDKCFKCHGPDQNQRKADLRLDVQEAIFGDRELIVRGDPEASEIYRRVTASDPDERMPPLDSKLSLSDEEVERIAEWIRTGAEWQDHWAFVLPRPLPLPNEPLQTARNPVDLFVQAERDRNGLKGTATADRETLIRRVTLDMTGIPPTPAEVDAFLADARPNAYGRLIDRLSASPRYGERMASLWLDAARYADTSGYQNDGPRDMWRWRDWVINAYNAGLPFDRFTIEQIAGDLLPTPSLDQLIATGFNRNHRGNSEGGIIPEEYQVEYVVDRVDTTSTVWLGLTMGCARCHDHKFDPLTQRDFYQFYAFFNNITEHGRAIKEGNSPPYVAAPTPIQQASLKQLEARLTTAESTFASELRRANREQWSFDPEDRRPTITPSLLHRFLLGAEAETGAPVPQSKLTWRDGGARRVTGKLRGAAAFDGRRFLDAGDIGDFGYRDRFSVMAWIRPKGDGTIVSKMTDERRADGYYVQLVEGRIHVNLVKRWLDDSIRVRSVERVSPGRWSHLAVTYDGSRVAAGIRIYLDGRQLRSHVELDAINQTFAAAKQPFRIGGGDGPDGRFHGAIDEVRIYSDAVSPSDVAIAAVAETPHEIAGIDPVQRNATQSAKVQRHYLEHVATGPLSESFRLVRSLRTELAELRRTLPTVMIMAERPARRRTFVLARGQYDQPGEPVSPGIPRRFPTLAPRLSTADRLDLARWIVSAENPLTARVAVNRYWQIFFGQGLVKTTEDFGIQGARPSHPELLDWLALEFRSRNWDVKALHRELTMSNTYRQSSQISPAVLQQDPDNRLLSRGPRQRLSAQMVRDQALAASGLLVERMGGPSVRPYQPKDLWQDIATDKEYAQSTGADLYRRSLYTYWKRTISPPAMAAFDASTRDTCQVRISKTNTPLQALTLLNDVTFVEAARVLAQQVAAAEQTVEKRLRLLFRRVLVRQPSDDELEILTAAFESHRQQFAAHTDLAAELLQVGDFPPETGFPQAELAAYAAVASMILNLDEAVMN